MQISYLCEDLIQARHQLLQESLRPGFNDYPIEQEYPIVLNPQHQHLSFCVYKHNTAASSPKTLLAHANLWPRFLVQPALRLRYPVGLVGNVATAPTHRGQGIMKQLFAKLWENALHSGLEALILWSDLVEFYHNLGFEACGRERRYYFTAPPLACLTSSAYEVSASPGQQVHLDLLAQLLQLRYPTSTYLERSGEEFKTLLQIPDTMVLFAYQKERLAAFAILGKGCDMVGIVHEWGALQGEALLAILQFILAKTQWPKVGLLAPYALSLELQELFKSYGGQEEVHPVALVKSREHSPVKPLLEQGFLWGLDSI